jgi:hypothetical protein
VFYQGDDSTCHESRCADYGATASHFGDLDQATSYCSIYSTSGLGRRHLVSAGGISDVDDYLDSITLHRLSPAVWSLSASRLSASPYEDIASSGPASWQATGDQRFGRRERLEVRCDATAARRDCGGRWRGTRTVTAP